MPDANLHTAVVLIIFNRPGTTSRVFEAIREARPPQLFIVADGPRTGSVDDPRDCAAARAIVEQVDWPCDVVHDYSGTNLGCRRRVASGLTRVFETVNQAIILEDDCVPHAAFFRYCEELLERWQDDDRIWSISGDNFQSGRRRTPYSYYFSRYIHVWGWATWRRAWRQYDDAMSLWPQVRDGGWLDDVLTSSALVAYWRARFEATYVETVDTWDYRWLLTCWLQHGLTILPQINLVANIGHGWQASHTTAISPWANLPTQPMPFPLDHPTHMIPDARADAYTESIMFTRPSWGARVRHQLGDLVRRFYRPMP